MRKRSKNISSTPTEAYIENFSHDGRGVARVFGKTTFIKGGLPGEDVTFKYTRKKKDFDEGVLLEVNKASKDRVEPLCPHYDMCGGCSLQHLQLDKQIEVKQNLLIELFSKYARVAPQKVIEPITADSWHYRDKARLSVRYVTKKAEVLVGFREKDNPRFIADIHNCLILNKKVADAIDPLRELITSFTDPKHIAQIEVAASDDEVALIFRNLEELSAQDLDKLQKFAQDFDFRIYLQPAGPESVTLFYPSAADNYLSYCVPEFGVEFKFAPTDFTQVNQKINQQMVSHAIELLELDQQDTVLDLFCGLGNFSLPIAKNCKEVIGVEGSQDMVNRAAMNAQNNNLANTKFIACDLDKDFASLIPKMQNVNKILLDPPRSGALEVIRQIENINIKRIVYVACNPITLARDTDILVNDLGYKLVSAGVMDMFPNTAHVESIALFVKD